MGRNKILFFIGKCLSLRHFPERIPDVRSIIQSGVINWELFVKLGNNHLVLPTIYVQLLEADLLNDLPTDLKEHLHYIYLLNYDRNISLKRQANNISALLNSYNIEPIFLKGTANLLSNLYLNIGERMIGDIDILVDKKDMFLTVDILKREGYYEDTCHNINDLMLMKHYPRLKNQNEIAAIEVHQQVLNSPYDLLFDYQLINMEKIRIETEKIAFILSSGHKVIHNMLHQQISHKGNFWANISLRQSYDLLLFSREIDILKVTTDFRKFPTLLNNYLAFVSKIFEVPILTENDQNYSTRFFLKKVFLLNNYSCCYFAYRFIKYLLLRISNYFSIITKAFYKKDVRKSLMWKLRNRNWYKNHLASYKIMFR